jgi:hypothetical protein
MLFFARGGRNHIIPTVAAVRPSVVACCRLLWAKSYRFGMTAHLVFALHTAPSVFTRPADKRRHLIICDQHFLPVVMVTGGGTVDRLPIVAHFWVVDEHYLQAISQFQGPIYSLVIGRNLDLVIIR